jgi:hypothetical protein
MTVQIIGGNFLYGVAALSPNNGSNPLDRKHQMVKVQFVGGPQNGMVREVPRLDPTVMCYVSPKTSYEPNPGDVTKVRKRIDAEYQLNRFAYTICDNLICRWSMVAYIYSYDGSSVGPRSVMAEAWTNQFEVKPQPDFLTQFEDWFLWTVYRVSAPCRELRILEHELWQAVDRARGFFNQFCLDEDIDVKLIEDLLIGNNIDLMGLQRKAKR